jgi:hypothetical protein
MQSEQRLVVLGRLDAALEPTDVIFDSESDMMTSKFLRRSGFRT